MYSKCIHFLFFCGIMNVMNKDIVIKRVTTIEECKACNQMFSELLGYEMQFDNSILPRMDVSNYYERTLNRDDSILFLASYDNESVGYVMAYKHEQKPTVAGNFVTVMHIYVRPEYRGCGVGKLLFENVEHWAKQEFGKCTIELDCFMDNKTAIEFYTKLEFKPVRVKMRKKVNL